jgi:exopolyphosphatase/guanosine-5'-triphosphate,3'-diphosphate pyrophosphatase
MARTIGAIRICKQKLQRHDVKRMRLVATEACRRARNGVSFLQQVQRETGLALEIIQPEEEARLAVISCAPLVSTRTEQLLVVDIGGGSTELVWIDLTAVPRRERPRAIMRLHAGFRQSPGPFPVAKVVDWISVPLGVATLRDQFEDVEDDAARFALMSWYFEENLQAFAPSAKMQAREGFQIIGTSGTVTTVRPRIWLKRYDRPRGRLRRSSGPSTRWRNEYLARPEGRRATPRFGKDRHELIMSARDPSGAVAALAHGPLSVADRGCGRAALRADERRWRAGGRAVGRVGVPAMRQSSRAQRDLGRPGHSTPSPARHATRQGEGAGRPPPSFAGRRPARRHRCGTKLHHVAARDQRGLGPTRSAVTPPAEGQRTAVVLEH